MGSLTKCRHYPGYEHLDSQTGRPGPSRFLFKQTNTNSHGPGIQKLMKPETAFEMTPERLITIDYFDEEVCGFSRNKLRNQRDNFM